MKTEDSGEDIKVGDTVWAKFEVEKIEPSVIMGHGTARVAFKPRPGHDEYGATSLATIFLWRDNELPRKTNAWGIIDPSETDRARFAAMMLLAVLGLGFALGLIWATFVMGATR